jgi:prepilin-type N-terminal cleavage/methylation domain-containing protein
MFRLRKLVPAAGFTLIELIVSMAVFSVVITISVGALLTLIASNEQLQNKQSVMTNLSFALDSMTREIRTGTHYFCAGRPNYSSGGPMAIFDSSDSQEVLSTTVNDCAGGKNGGDKLQGVSFIEGGESITGGAGDRILYYYDNFASSPNQGKIMRRVGNGAAQSIVSSGIYITDAEFYVSGSAPQNGSSAESDQASVTIFLEAVDKKDSAANKYRIQTTVTQRTLDI